MASNSEWMRDNLLKGLIESAQEDFYGDAEDWQPAYLGIAPHLDNVVISDNISDIPVGYFIEQACMDASSIAVLYFDLR